MPRFFGGDFLMDEGLQEQLKFPAMRNRVGHTPPIQYREGIEKLTGKSGLVLKNVLGDESRNWFEHHQKFIGY